MLVFSRIGKTVFAIVPVRAEIQVTFGVIILALVVLGNDTKVCVEIHNWFPFLTFLCGDNDNTVCRLGTVNGSGRSILQHVYLRNILRIDFTHISGEYHVIHHYQGRIVTIQGTLSANLIRTASFGRRTKSDIQAGNSRAQQVFHIEHAFLHHVCGLHLRNGSRQVFLAHRAITNNHDFFQHLIVFVQDDAQRRLFRLQADFLSGIANVGHRQHRACRYRQCKLAVYIRNGTVGRTFFRHIGTNQRFTVRIGYDTRHRLFLSRLPQRVFPFFGYQNHLSLNGESHIIAQYLRKHLRRRCVLKISRHPLFPIQDIFFIDNGVIRLPLHFLQDRFQGYVLKLIRHALRVYGQTSRQQCRHEQGTAPESFVVHDIILLLNWIKHYKKTIAPSFPTDRTMARDFTQPPKRYLTFICRFEYACRLSHNVREPTESMPPICHPPFLHYAKKCGIPYLPESAYPVR